MSQPVHSSHERRAAASRLERAGLDPAMAAAVIEEIHEGGSGFATADQVAKVEDHVAKVEDQVAKLADRVADVEVGLARLQGDVRAVESGLREVEARLGGRIDVLAAEVSSMRTSFDARFEAVDRRMDEGFGALRRENRLLLLFFSTMLGLLMALFRFGVL